MFEDLHWLDPTSRELLGRLVESICDLPVMILVTARSGFRGVMVAAAVDDRRAVAAAVAGRCRGHGPKSVHRPRDPGESLRSIIARRTDGVPLFVEEVARVLLQLDPFGDLGDDYTGLPDQAIPASLRELLMARLDRSGAAKEIAQITAVIGRSAQRAVVAEVAALSEDALGQPLAALCETGVLISEFVEGAEGYTFSHALLRDAAYDSLLRDDRRRLHLRVARALVALDATDGGAAAGAAGNASDGRQ